MIMPKLGKREIVVRNEIDYTQNLSFEVEINVSKGGEFYFTLTEEQKERLTKMGVDLSKSANRRTNKLGTFYDTSLDKLIGSFRELVADAVAADIIEDKCVIIYKISTACSYTISEGVPVPNGCYLKKEEKDKNGYCKWYSGEDDGRESFGFHIYARIYKKQVLKFRSGQEKTFYWVLKDNEEKERLGEYGKMLNSFILNAANIKDPSVNSFLRYSMNGRFVIDYNEPNAKFFYDLLISVCKLNEQIKDFVKEPEKMQALINSSNKLLT